MGEFRGLMTEGYGKHRETSRKTQESKQNFLEAEVVDTVCPKLAKSLGVPMPVIVRLKAEFDRFDKDNSGEIDQQEFMSIVRTLPGGDKLGMSMLKVAFQQIDEDKSGYVGFSEFAEWYV